MGKRGIYEYVNLQKKDAVSRNGKKYKIVVAVSDTPNEITRTSTVGKQLAALGFLWVGRWYQKFANKMTQADVEAIKKINNELTSSGGQTGNVQEFQSMLETLKAEVAAAEIPLLTKTELETKLEGFIKQISNATAEQADAIFQRYLTVTSKFHTYSDENKILIYAQQPDATRVAARSTWKEMGRDIVDIKQAITINCGNKIYMNNKGRRPYQDEYTLKQQRWDKEYERKVGANLIRPNPQVDADIQMRKNVIDIKFAACPVYDISNTTGADIPPETEQGNWTGEINTNNDNSELANAVFSIAKKSLESNGIQVTQNPATAGEAGWSRRGQINVSSDVTGTYAVSTILKEWAGDLLHQEGGKFYDKTLKYFEDKGDLTPAHIQQIQKVQESTVAAAIFKYFNLPTDEHPTYMALLKAQGGLDSNQLINENVSTITAVSNYIIKELNKHEDELNAVAGQPAEAQPEQ